MWLDPEIDPTALPFGSASRSARIALLVVAACRAAAPAPVVPVHNSVPVIAESCAPPADFLPAEMAKATRNGGGGEVRILAWQQTIDDRPLRIDSALIWTKSAGSGYGLAHLYRHPDDGPGAPWHVMMIYDAPGFVGQESYAAPPTHAELDALVAESRWEFGPEQDFKLVASGLCADAWVKSFYEQPWHAYKRR